MRRSSFNVTYRRREDWDGPPDRPSYRIGFEKDGEDIDLLRAILNTLQGMCALHELDGKRIRVTLSILDEKTS
jgi:hypothetical protein